MGYLLQGLSIYILIKFIYLHLVLDTNSTVDLLSTQKVINKRGHKMNKIKMFFKRSFWEIEVIIFFMSLALGCILLKVVYDLLWMLL